MSGPVEREIKCVLGYFLSIIKEKWRNVFSGAGVLKKKDQEPMSPADSVSFQDMTNHVVEALLWSLLIFVQIDKWEFASLSPLLFWATDGGCGIGESPAVDLSRLWLIGYLCLFLHSLFHPGLPCCLPCHVSRIFYHSPISWNDSFLLFELTFDIVLLHSGKLSRSCRAWCQILSLEGQQIWYYVVSTANQELQLRKKHWWSSYCRCQQLVEYGVLVNVFCEVFSRTRFR